MYAMSLMFDKYICDISLALIPHLLILSNRKKSQIISIVDAVMFIKYFALYISFLQLIYIGIPTEELVNNYNCLPIIKATVLKGDNPLFSDSNNDMVSRRLISKLTLGVPIPLFGDPFTGVITEFFKGLLMGDFPVILGISKRKDLSIIVNTSP